MSRIAYAGIVLLFCLPTFLRAQDEEVSLGDLARSVRKSKPVDEQKVIDNDNFAAVMDKAESARLNGKPVFSIDPSGKTFRMTSPDGTCSLSFDARAGALISTPYVASDLPRDELLKLDGPATIQDGMLQVAVHNRTGWDLKEIVVGITVLQPQAATELLPARLVPAEAIAPPEKLPDLTMLYHLKGTGTPDSTTVFSASLGEDLGLAKDWHWAIVSARGIPPASPSTPNSPALQVTNSSPNDTFLPASAAPVSTSVPAVAVPAQK
jgi:hypothetical protein